MEGAMEIVSIKNDQDYRRILREIEGLMHAKRETPEGDRLDILVTLVEQWEAKHHPLDLSDSGRVDEMEPLERNRRVSAVEDMTPDQLAALERSEVPREYDYLNAELEDWKPPADDQ
jgi:antitoxin component HigA of HigAB toxin-antitoxin module